MLRKHDRLCKTGVYWTGQTDDSQLHQNNSGNWDRSKQPRIYIRPKREQEPESRSGSLKALGVICMRNHGSLNSVYENGLGEALTDLRDRTDLKSEGGCRDKEDVRAKSDTLVLWPQQMSQDLL